MRDGPLGRLQECGHRGRAVAGLTTRSIDSDASRTEDGPHDWAPCSDQRYSSLTRDHVAASTATMSPVVKLHTGLAAVPDSVSRATRQ